MHISTGQHRNRATQVYKILPSASPVRQMSDAGHISVEQQNLSGALIRPHNSRSAIYSEKSLRKTARGYLFLPNINVFVDYLQTFRIMKPE
jgi:hypothetical protein